MLKVSIVSECVFTIIKLAQDALKELVRIKSCKYESLVATPLKCISCRINFTSPLFIVYYSSWWINTLMLVKSTLTASRARASLRSFMTTSVSLAPSSLAIPLHLSRHCRPWVAGQLSRNCSPQARLLTLTCEDCAVLTRFLQLLRKLFTPGQAADADLWGLCCMTRSLQLLKK